MVQIPQKISIMSDSDQTIEINLTPNQLQYEEEKLKENRKFHIPTIALTADALADAKEKYLKEGFADYISKPFNKDEIQEKLMKVFKDAEEIEVL